MSADPNALLLGVRALVTGGGDGIGAATCRRFAAAGATVAVLDRNGAKAAAVADEIGGHAIECDIADRAALGEAVDEAALRLGGLSTLVNNAGFGMLERLEDYHDADWDRLIEVNLTATFVAMRTAVPHLRQCAGASVINNVGGVGQRPTRGEGPYSAAKAGVIALTKSAAIEWAPSVRVNVVSPVFAETALTRPLLDVPSLRRQVEDNIPFGRVGTADEVADVIVFLASGMAGYVTGQEVVVDGGALLVSAQADPILRQFLADRSTD